MNDIISRFNDGCVEITATAGWRLRSGIYAIIHRDSGNIYVGSASCIKTRIGYHRSKLRNNKHDNSHLQRAWNRYGESAFAIVVIEECPIESLLLREAYWMEETKCADRSHGYNLDRIACRKMHSDETRNKISVSNTGKKLTLEAKQKISAANTGRRHPKRTAEQIERHRQAGLRQHPVTQETRDKMSASRKGRIITLAWREKLRESQKNIGHRSPLRKGPLCTPIG